MSSGLPSSLVPAGPPRSVEQLIDDAESFEYSDYVRFRNWLRSARQIRQQAEIYRNEGNLQEAFFLFYRHVILVLERLRNHPEVKASAENRQLLRVAKKDAEISVSRLEELKPKIKDAHERYLKRQSEIARQRASAEGRAAGRPGPPARLASSESLLSHSRPSSASYEDFRNVAYYSGHERPDLALKTARQLAGLPEPPRQAKRDSGGGDFNLEEGMKNIRLQLDRRPESPPWDPLQPKGTPGYRRTPYPSVPLARPVPQSTYERELREELGGREEGSIAPSIPQKIPIRSHEQAPVLPPKEGYSEAGLTSWSPLGVAQDASPPSLPPKAKTLDAQPAAKQHFFKPSAFLENSTPLRSVFLPPALRRDFLSLARTNTARKIETCGILCGLLKNNALFVTNLVIPEQDGTTDTCEMTVEGEIALFDWVDGRDLLTLGWIHTHPTQSCFMSSRDLHTHCGYQSMIHESIAVVCAPSISKGSGDSDYGIFRLTDPPGMPCVRKCRDSRVFHPHDVENLYTDCQRPGHVVELDGLSYEVHDLRKGK